MPLLEQRLIVQKVLDKFIIRYECEHEEPVMFIISKYAAMQLSGMLEEMTKTNGPSEISISI